MIIAKLSGGLGNQMFQYAAARALAEKNRCTLRLETQFYKQSKNRIFDLNNFNISAKEISVFDIYKFYKSSKYYFSDLLLNKNRFNENHPSVYKEKYFQFDSEFFKQKQPLILDGYWQSEKYFSLIAAIIMKEFQWINEDKFKDFPLLNKICNCNSVSIHLRKGDYLSNPLISAIHGIVPDEYYLSAIKLLKSKTKIDKIYIFSDDHKATDAFIHEHGIGINASGTSTDTMLDFYLLQKCKHNIIANSSFSWWSAWLNPNPDKIVIAPKRWFVDESKDISDLFPPTWITL